MSHVIHLNELLPYCHSFEVTQLPEDHLMIETKHLNGYGASILSQMNSDLWEIAVLDDKGIITYDTPITDDVVYDLHEEDVYKIIREINYLPHLNSILSDEEFDKLLNKLS